MTNIAGFLIPLFIGAGTAWWLRRRPSGVRHVSAGVAVLCAPVVLILISNVLGSDALGWIGGLSLMVMVMSAPPLALGAMGGWLFAGHHGERDKTTVVEEAALHIPTQQSIEPAGVCASTLFAPSVRSRWSQQGGLLVAVAGVASAFWVVMAAGFRLNDQRVPAELNAGLAPALLILVTALALGVRHGWRSRGMFTPAPHAFRRIRRPASKAMAEYTAWRIAMASDPRRPVFPAG